MNCPNTSCDGTVKIIGGNEQPATMEHLKIHNCYVCPWCGFEVWPSYNKGEITTEDAREALRDEARRQNSMRKKTSQRKAGRKGREKIVKITAYWLPE